MSSRSSEDTVRAAVVDRASGKARVVEAARVSRLGRDRLIEVLRDTGLVPKNQHAELTSHVLLSAQIPWVENKGHLHVLNSRAYDSSSPSIDWVPETGQPVGRLEIWLDGLEAGETYLARLEVGAVGTSSFDVGAVALGGGLVSQTFQIDAGFDTLLMQFASGGGGIGLIRIESAEWSFYEAEISRIQL